MECARCLACVAKLDNVQHILRTTQRRTKMNHPLTGNLRDFSDGDLQKKITELGKRLVFAHQTGNAQMIGQLEMIMEDYRQESIRRDRERTEKANEASGDKGKNWDDLIDI